MTLDEAIKHAEKVMVENLEKTKGRSASDPIAINCFECAEEHRQLAEWLKELKQLREQTSWIPVSKRVPETNNSSEEKRYYLTTTKNLEVYCDYWNGENFNRTEMVIAWMPLPDPYDPQESEG